jgi:predicted amidohydrolase YtcJ
MRTVGDEDLRAGVEWARRNRVQVGIHAMGDRATNHLLDLFEDEEPWMGELPSIRLEHGTLFTQKMMDRVTRAKMRFSLVTHSIFFFAEYDSYAQNLSDEQFAIAYPIRSSYERLPLVAMASDAPATAWFEADNVFTSVQAAVDRRSYDGSDMGQAEAVTVGQALHLYTGKAAQISALQRVGLIAPGYDGNFVVLDRDIFDVGVSKIARTQVQRTVVGGDVVFERESLGSEEA